LLQRAADRAEDILRLHIGIARQRLAPRGGSGNMLLRPDAHPAAVSVNLLERTAGRNQLWCHIRKPSCYL
jgi:hypothetical protein